MGRNGDDWPLSCVRLVTRFEPRPMRSLFLIASVGASAIFQIVAQTVPIDACRLDQGFWTLKAQHERPSHHSFRQPKRETGKVRRVFN